MIKRTILPCGLTVLSERFEEFPSVVLSYTAKSGARNESLAHNGIHHLIEHMLFKGGQRYNLKQIADLSDRLGGQLNAFTSKEVTQFYIKTIDEKLDEAFALLNDIVLHATFPPGEFAKEKNVIMQEIRESEDNPDTHVFEVFFSAIYPDNALGYPIEGTVASVGAMECADVQAYYRDQYRPANLVLAAAGKIEHERLVELAQAACAGLPAATPTPLRYTPAKFHVSRFSKANPALNQSYIVLGLDGLPAVAPERHKLMLLNDILGSNMSSRLFQAIREERGLAYTISSFPDAFMECGLLMVYAIVEPAQTQAYIAAVQEELRLFRRNGITQEELERARDHIKASLLLSIENNTAKMRFNINQELCFQTEQTIAAIITEINQATCADINALIDRLIDLEHMAQLIYGPTPA
jgi:predicted Zn-dependent peptidase